MMPVLFLESRDGQCRYPVSDEPNLEMMVCGEPTKPGSSYCPACHAIVYRPSRAMSTTSGMFSYNEVAFLDNGDPVELTEVIR